jgi:glycosyltransferase involved in cell wall biosynthesis
MKVLYVNPGVHAHGGAEQSLLALIDELPGLGVDVHVVSFGPGTLQLALESRRVAHSTLHVSTGFRAGARHGSVLSQLAGAARGVPALLRAMAALAPIIRRERPDVVHSNGLRAHVLLPLVRGTFARVASLRDIPQGAFDRRTTEFVVDHIDVAVANSPVMANSLSDARGHVRVVLNPVRQPTPRDSMTARARLGIDQSAFVIACLAHLHWSKGQLDLVKATGRLPENAHVVFAGGDLYGAESETFRTGLERAIAESPARDRIRLLGLVEDVSWVYGAADVVAHTSIRPESFGRTIVEGMLSGRPVVASDAGSPGEMLTDGDTALLYPAGDPDALSSRLLLLMKDPAFAQSLADRGHAWATRTFAPSRHAASMLEVYREVARARA